MALVFLAVSPPVSRSVATRIRRQVQGRACKTKGTLGLCQGCLEIALILVSKRGDQLADPVFPSASLFEDPLPQPLSAAPPRKPADVTGSRRWHPCVTVGSKQHAL